MGENTPARAATVGELANFRSHNQWSRIHLAIQPAVTVYTARINQTFTTFDGLYELDYDGGSGTLSEVIPNLLLLIGSSAGAHDHGICRVRKEPSAVKFYIGMTSGIRPQDDDYLTVIDFMPLCAKHPTGAGVDVRMDVDIPYSAAADAPIPVLGPLAAVLRLTGETVTFTPPDPSDLSWSPIGAAITGYLFDAPGASATADLDTTQPTFTYDTAGWYRWSCTVTDENAISSTGYRWLVVEPASPQFALQSCEGSVDDGGWSYTLRAVSGVDLDTVRDRAMAILWTEDYYDNLPVSIGPIAGYENILAVGWIEGESISHNPLDEALEFTVRGPAFWLNQLQAFPFLAADSASTPTGWLQIKEATIDKGLSRILHWGSNASQILDCVVTGDVNRVATLSAPDDNLLDQLDSLAERVFARSLCNRFGQLFINTDPQYMDSTARSALPVIQAVTSADWRESLELERVTVSACSMMELSAYESYNGTKEVAVHSRACGNIPLEYGAPKSQDNFIVADQDECNRVTGVALAIENNEYPPIPINFACNQRLVDICPPQVCTLTVAEAATVRGISFTDKRIIARRINLNLNAMKIRMDVEFEAEVTSNAGIAYFPPTPIYDNVPTNFPDFEMDGFPGLDTEFPDYVPTLPITNTDCKTSTDVTNAPSNGFTLVFDKTQLNGADADRIAYAYYPCWVRMGTALAKTQIVLLGNFMGDSKDYLHVYGVKNGTRVVTATTAFGTMGGYATFAPVAAVQVDGFEIEIDEGAGFAAGDIIESGSVDASAEDGISIGEEMVIGQNYCIESTGGPYVPAADWRNSYQFQVEQTGRIGYNNFNWDGSYYATLLPTGCEYLEVIDTYYGRVYFVAAGSVNFRVYDGPSGQWANNTGTLGYVLREAMSVERKLMLGSSMLLNVCAV